MKVAIIKALIIKASSQPSSIKVLNKVRTPKPRAEITSLTI